MFGSSLVCEVIKLGENSVGIQYFDVQESSHLFYYEDTVLFRYEHIFPIRDLEAQTSKG